MLDIRGRVVIYSTVGCPHCLAAKNSLKDAGIPFIEVSVNRFPTVRTWLQGKTGKTSVPQIFFNETYVGGNDDLQKALQDEEAWKKLVEDIQENEAKEDELVIPHPSEAVDVPEDETKFVCASDPTVAVIEELKESGILRSQRLSLFSTVKNAFSGQQFVQWIMENKKINEEEALKIGTELLTKKFIKSTQDGSTFENSAQSYYSLNDNSDSLALNAGLTQNCVVENANELSELLRRLIIRLFDDHVSSDGKTVNYKAIKESETYKEYVMLSRELQHVSVENMTQDELKAFFINIYNALVIHATVENGPPTNWLSRYKFFDKTSYLIGGHDFSLNEIENGILRANKKGVIQLFAPFGKSDPRRSFSLIQVDPRIHFALNCGAKSCPPIKTYSAENINDELRVATESYLETDEALKIDVENGIVYLSSLLRWYASDFGDSAEDILRWVSRNVAFAEKKEGLEKILESKKWKVRYVTYDWASNEKE
ncbi:uncharacterized protein [Macrobrachium rosenbergii]|uniref:uncharacterized protein n=1 Tax=Macrobrachium rosenbergii TaxID=79674 RepID=UPI0034D6688E